MYATANKKIKILVLMFSVLIVSLLLLLTYFYYLSTPSSIFPEHAILEITPGMSVREITQSAKEQGIVRSDLLLYTLLTYIYDPTHIYAGTYIFPKPMNVFEVAHKLASNDIENILLSLTFPEGIRREKMASIASQKLSQFDTQQYLELSKEKEGYLFPETYHIPEDFTAKQLYNLQTKTLEKVLAPLQERIASSGLSIDKILTLASIVEREANDEQSMKLVSGILQNRLTIGMPLQADASIEYILDKPLSALTPKDLTIDSPYNTYLHTGLPPTPIGNPGLKAIMAVLEPTPSEYLYYITDTEGNFHYAKTLAEHNINIAKYLR